MKERKAPRDKRQLDPASEAWNTLPWRKLEKHCLRIQKRIYRASQRGNTRAVHKLQKLLMKSEAARLLAVRRVTQENRVKINLFLQPPFKMCKDRVKHQYKRFRK